MKETGGKEKYSMSMVDGNGKSEKHIQAEFKADALQQRKVYFGDQGIARIGLGIKKNKIPDSAHVMRDADWRDAKHKRKLGAVQLQISFMVTIGEKMPVFAGSERNGSRNLAGFSVLLSTSPFEKEVLNKLSGVNDILKRKESSAMMDTLYSDLSLSCHEGISHRNVCSFKKFCTNVKSI